MIRHICRIVVNFAQTVGFIFALIVVFEAVSLLKDQINEIAFHCSVIFFHPSLTNRFRHWLKLTCHHLMTVATRVQKQNTTFPPFSTVLACHCTAHVQRRLFADYCHLIYFHFSLPAGLVLWLVFSLLPQSYLPKKYQHLPPDRGQISPLHPWLEGNIQGDAATPVELSARLASSADDAFLWRGGGDVWSLTVGGCFIPAGQIVLWKMNGINVLKRFLTASCGERLHTNPLFCSLSASFPLRHWL